MLQESVSASACGHGHPLALLLAFTSCFFLLGGGAAAAAAMQDGRREEQRTVQ